MLVFGISLITLGAVAPSLREKFGLSELEAGAMFSILPFGILAGSLVFGPVADRYGYKVVLALASIFMFAGFQGIAWSTDGMILNGCILIFGFGGGVINGASNASVADISVDKGANISLIGVFYAIGALGMPSILGALGGRIPFEYVVSGVGYFTLIVGLVFLATRFPAPKHADGIPLAKALGLLRDPTLLLIGFFLFCQSSFEGIVNNWTTTFLISEVSLPEASALYALSLYVAGMAVMRLLIGGVLRKMAPARILAVSFGLLVMGTAILQFAQSFVVAAGGLVILGAGLAGGFPVMLGMVGELYSRLSGTAFSIVLTIALLGNMLVNFTMGWIAETAGVQHLISVILVLLVTMIILTINIIRKTNRNTYAGKTMAQ